MKKIPSIVFGTLFTSCLIAHAEAQTSPDASSKLTVTPAPITTTPPQTGQPSTVTLTASNSSAATGPESSVERRHSNKPEEALSSWLQLTADQKRQIKPIIEDSVLKGRQLFEETKQEISSTLNPEQRAKVEELISKWVSKQSAWIHNGMDDQGDHAYSNQAAEVTNGLKLTDEQKAKVETIMASIVERAHKDEVDEINRQMKTQIVSVLTPAQQQVLSDKAKLEDDEANLNEQKH